MVLAFGKCSQRNTLLSVFERNNSGQLTEIPEDSKPPRVWKNSRKAGGAMMNTGYTTKQIREEFNARLLKSRRTSDCRFDLDTFSGTLKRSKYTNYNDYQDFSQT